MKQYIPLLFGFIVIFLASLAVSLFNSHLGALTALLLGYYAVDPLVKFLKEKSE